MKAIDYAIGILRGIEFSDMTSHDVLICLAILKLSTSGKSTLAGIGEKTGLEEGHLRVSVHDLKERGIIVRIRSEYGNYWKLSDYAVDSLTRIHQKGKAQQ